MKTAVDGRSLRVFLCIVCSFVLIISCAHYSRMTDVRREGTGPLPKIWVIQAVDLKTRVPDPETERNIPEILGLLAGKYRLSIAADKAAAAHGGRSYALCRLWLKEQTFARSLDQYNSVAGLLTLSDPETGAVIARAVYAEESEETLRSFQHLYSVLDELLGLVTSGA